MTPRDKKYFYTKVLALRRQLQSLEEELGNQLETPALPKRKNKMREHFERRYEMGISGKPIYLKSKSEKT